MASAEDQAQEIMDNLHSMAENAGQESILGEAEGSFTDWSAGAIDDQDSPPNYDEMIESLGLSPDEYDATDNIWDEGYSETIDGWGGEGNDDHKPKAEKPKPGGREAARREAADKAREARRQRERLDRQRGRGFERGGMRGGRR